MTRNETKAGPSGGRLLVIESGRRIVVRLDREHLDDWSEADTCREQLLDLIDKHAGETVTFDLTGIPYLSSGWLELLIAPVREGVTVTLTNVSPHLRTILGRTRLDRLVEVCQPGQSTECDSSVGKAHSH